MGIIKKLFLVSVAVSLSACSMFEGKNTFMTYQDLQDQVQSHDTELQDMKAKLSKVDQLEAEVAQLKKSQGMDSSTATPSQTPATTDNSVAQRAAMASTDTAPAVTVAPMAASQTQPSETAPQPVKMVTAAPVTQVSAPAPKAAPAKQQYKSKDNTYGVQLAAYGSREEAAHGWKVLSQASPDVYVNLVPHVNTKQVNGRTMYQLKVGPFLDRAYSVDFCNMLKQKGKDCLVSKYDGQPL